jgi:hypothetical protein
VPVAWQLTLDEQFANNGGGWTEGDFSNTAGTSSYRFVGGTYEGSYSAAIAAPAFWSTIAFTPGSGLYYVETEVTSYLTGSQCGLALQTSSGSVLTVGLGNSQIVARLYTGGVETNSGSWDAPMADPIETEIGLWIDGTTITIYVDDVELDTFEEPLLSNLTQLGISLMGGSQAYCGFDYLVGYIA